MSDRGAAVGTWMLDRVGDETEPSAEAAELLRRAEAAGSREDAVALVAEALTAELSRAMTKGRMTIRAKRIAKPQVAAALLRSAGLDRLLVEGWIRGRVTHGAAERHLAEMRTAMAERRANAEDLKYGILAFDGFAQRMAIADPSGRFSYPAEENRARDLMLTFARALHR